jgi:hypothetical protein
MVDFGVREKIQMHMVEEGWGKWDNYQFTSWRELHIYSPRARLSIPLKINSPVRL